MSFDIQGKTENAAKTSHTVRSGLTDAIAWKEPKGIFEDDYVVLDSKKVPQSTIEQIEKKMIKVNRRLKKQFPDFNTFDQKLRQEVTSDVNGNVSVDQLRDFLLAIVEKDMID